MYSSTTIYDADFNDAMNACIVKHLLGLFATLVIISEPNKGLQIPIDIGKNERKIKNSIDKCSNELETVE